MITFLPDSTWETPTIREADFKSEPPVVHIGKKRKRNHRKKSLRFGDKSTKITGAAFAARQMKLQDDRFIRAMIAAIRAGLERPDMVGVDTRPCTKAPVFVMHGEPRALIRTPSKDEVT